MERLGMLLLTNNIRVKEELFREGLTVEYIETDLMGLLKEARNHIHLGAKLLSHPLSGSIKPNENPYKSLLLEEGSGGLDVPSLCMIENALRVAEDFLNLGKRYIEDEKEDRDYASIDLSLIKSAFANIRS